jgi:phosphoribosylaminoimidazolecarboxamide formyltransferase / IMP cyclohydrolase
MKSINAIISCYDKTGLKEFVSQLVKLNPTIKIFSSSGTFKELEAVAKDNLVEISEYTGFPEMPGGLVKTLHPKIHAGILADVNNSEHTKYLDENGIETFDLVVVNLYPFEKVVGGGADLEKARQNIDIGGVALIEAAAKNFRRVAIVCSSNDYAIILKEIKENNEISSETRLQLAKKAFAYIADYLAAISRYFEEQK